MFRKVHFRLTILFTTVSSLLLIIMSILYLYLSYHSVITNSFVSFQSDMNTFVTNCENRSVISYDWLLKLESDGKYSFFLYDRDVPFSFVNNTKSEQEIALASRIRDYYHNNYAEGEKNAYSSYHTEFPYHERGGKQYYVGIGTIPGRTSNLDILVLYPLNLIHKQMNLLYMQFTCIIVVAISALWLFSWYYTKRLLKPIEENQLKQGQFISAASHELRTPVATILSALAAMEKGNEQEKKEFSQIAKKEGERLSFLVNDMLSLARSDSHTFPIQMENVEPDTLLIDAYEAFLAPAKENGLTLEITLPENSVSSCKMDPARIKQVIAILISNAISYSREKGYIRLSLFEFVKEFQIFVCDNGIGISDVDKEHIFERFYRADISRNKKEHFGLGLCIAKEIMVVHNGTIEVKDTPLGGTTFILHLPK